MAKLTDEQIQKLKTVYPVLVAIETKNGAQLVFRKPKRLEFDQWFDKMRNSEQPSQSGLLLAQQCLVYPTPQEFMTVLDESPFLLMCKGGVIDTITEMAGDPQEIAETKKL